jgi:hypothetical protein
MVSTVHRAVDHRADEPVHMSAVHIRVGVGLTVRPSLLQLAARVVRRNARAEDRVGNAHRRRAVTHGDALGAGERAEVVIERPVLLDDEDEVLQARPRLLELRQTRDVVR